MAEPVTPVETAVGEQNNPDSRVAAKALTLGLGLLNQDQSPLAMARQMRELASLSDTLLGDR